MPRAANDQKRVGLPGAFFPNTDYREGFYLVKENLSVERLQNGVYFLAYTTILGTKGRISLDKYLEKKYLSAAVSGQGLS